MLYGITSISTRMVHAADGRNLTGSMPGNLNFIIRPNMPPGNQIEVFFSILNRRCLRLSSFRSKEELREAVMMFIRIWNERRTSF